MQPEIWFLFSSFFLFLETVVDQPHQIVFCDVTELLSVHPVWFVDKRPSVLYTQEVHYPAYVFHPHLWHCSLTASGAQTSGTETANMSM